MAKKLLIIFSIVFLIIIGGLCYYIYALKPVYDYVPFTDESSNFINLQDNGNEVILTRYTSGGIISSEEIYTFENDSLKQLKIINHSINILQAKENVKTNPYENTTVTRDKNKVTYSYTDYDMYGKSKQEVLNSINEFINIYNNN